MAKYYRGIRYCGSHLVRALLVSSILFGARFVANTICQIPKKAAHADRWSFNGLFWVWHVSWILYALGSFNVLKRDLRVGDGLTIELVWLFVALGAAGAIAGITAGLFGNGGGFVVVPALVGVFSIFDQAEGQLMYVAIGTSLASIVVASARSVQSHRSHGAVDFAVLRSWSGWLVLGVGVGLLVASVTNGENLFIIFAAGVLAYSVYFLFPNLFAGVTKSLSMPTGIFRAGLASFLGGFSALLGIGGGTITVMTMVMCNRPVHQAVATAAGVGFIIGVPGTLGFLILGWHVNDLPFGSLGYINLPALFAICIASVMTAPVGAKWAHSLNEVHLKRLFGGYLVIVSASMFYKSMQVQSASAVMLG